MSTVRSARASRGVAAVAAAVVIVAACAGWTRSTSPPADEPTMAEALEETRAATFELIELLASYGLMSPDASMGITTCEDLGGMGQPLSSGRFLQPNGGVSTIDDARAILALLVEEGWEPVNSDRFEGGIEDLQTNRFIVSVRRGDQRARVGLFKDESYVPFNVAGSCLPNTEDERELYRAVGEWDLLGPPTTSEPGQESGTTVAVGSA